MIAEIGQGMIYAIHPDFMNIWIVIYVNGVVEQYCYIAEEGYNAKIYSS